MCPQIILLALQVGEWSCQALRYTRQVYSRVGRGYCKRLCDGGSHHRSPTDIQLDHMGADRSGKRICDNLDLRSTVDRTSKSKHHPQPIQV